MSHIVRPPRKQGDGLASFGESAGNRKPAGERHLIDEIKFQEDWIICTCAWKGPIDDFKQHRKDSGVVRQK